MSLVRQMRGGKDYDAQWGKGGKGEGPIAELLAQRFRIAKRRHGSTGSCRHWTSASSVSHPAPATSSTCSGRSRPAFGTSASQAKR